MLSKSLLTPFQGITKGKRRLAFYTFGLVSFGVGSLANYFSQAAEEEQTKLQQASKDLADFKVHHLYKEEVTDYPWAGKNLKDWEYKIVKIRGYLGPGRIFVRKDKDGKKGYSVFAPFYTASFDLNNHSKCRPRHNSKAEVGLPVDLGWVPIEHRKEISVTTNPLEVITWEGAEFKVLGGFTDPYSGFEYKADYGEEPAPQYADLTAIVRAGESWNPLVGNVNFPSRHLYQFVDLDLLSRLFLFPNEYNARAAYLQRIVPDLDESSDPVYPIPSTKDNFIQDNFNPNKLRNLAKVSTYGALLAFPAMFFA